MIQIKTKYAEINFMQPEMVINMFVANKCVFVQTARSPNRTHALLLHAQALELCCASPGVHRVPAGLHAQALELCCASPGPHRVPESSAPGASPAMPHP